MELRGSRVLVAALVLAVAGCGDGDSSGSGDSDRRVEIDGASDEASDGASGGSGADAYAAFARAVRDGDEAAFGEAVRGEFWSDLTPERTNAADYLADLHWAFEQDLMPFPDAAEVQTAAEVGVSDFEVGAIGRDLGIDDLSGEDVAAATVADGYVKVDDSCFDDPDPEECAPTDDRLRQDLRVILVRVDDAWQVSGIEPA